jgi:hypothetical protein
MPPVILWALCAVGAAFAGRFLVKESRRVNAELYPDVPQPDASQREERATARTLERDPRTGVYRPK